MSALDPLLQSYLDLARHLDPLRYAEGAPDERLRRLGVYDRASVSAHLVALRSVANAVEELDLAERDDEVDRTMLLNTIRADLVRLRPLAAGESIDPSQPLQHLHSAIDDLMGEDYDAACEEALRDRIAAVPAFLAGVRDSLGTVPRQMQEWSVIQVEFLDDLLDSVSERIEEASVAPAQTALGDFSDWLDDAAVSGVPLGLGVEDSEAWLANLASSPLGVKGTLRMLELRRAGVDRSLARSAEELGVDQPLLHAQELLQATMMSWDTLKDYWADEWRRVAHEMTTLGLPVVPADPPDVPVDVADAWSHAAFAVRDHSARMLDAACAAHPRPVRRVLMAQGLRAGWGRTVAALLRGTDVFGMPERRLMMSYRALLEGVAAETDLMFHARLAEPEALIQRVQELTLAGDGEGRIMVAESADQPFETVAAALAHEAWQSWYAETGGDPVQFLLTALRGGGLAVHLARWANG
jgi:hypothetical protein